jgi:cobalamin biosynthesis Mg chelatase CobN
VTSQPSSDGGAPVAAILVVAVAVLALAGAAYAAARRRTG